MMERCPLCNARLRAKNICNRCEADLSLLLAIESEAEQLDCASGPQHAGRRNGGCEQPEKSPTNISVDWGLV